MINDYFTFRIVTNKGTVDFSPTYEGIIRKYKRYAQDCLDGYCDFVSVIREHTDTRRGYTMFTYRRGEPIKTLQEPFNDFERLKEG